jgi:hypothetical protein
MPHLPVRAHRRSLRGRPSHRQGARCSQLCMASTPTLRGHRARICASRDRVGRCAPNPRCLRGAGCRGKHSNKVARYARGFVRPARRPSGYTAHQGRPRTSRATWGARGTGHATACPPRPAVGLRPVRAARRSALKRSTPPPRTPVAGARVSGLRVRAQKQTSAHLPQQPLGNPTTTAKATARHYGLPVDGQTVGQCAGMAVPRVKGAVARLRRSAALRP